MAMEQGVLKEINFLGDFFAAEDPSILAEKLVGCPLDPAALAAALSGAQVDRYFMGLTKENLIGLLLQ